MNVGDLFSFERIYSLRNTYRVPPGKTVTVDTPQGTKTYRGGQYVPPEQLGKARVSDSKGTRQSAGSNGGGSGGGGEADEAPGWDEIANQFKMTDISNPLLVNQSSYNVGQFLETPIDTSSNKVHPVSRFGGQLTTANLVNAVPGFKKLLGDLQLKIQIIHPADAPTKNEKILGKNFIKVGDLDLKNRTVRFWQHEVTLKDMMTSVAEFISHKVGLAASHSLLTRLNNSEQTSKQLDEKIEETQRSLKSYLDQYAKKHGSKQPKPGQDSNIDQLQEQLQQLVTSKQQEMQLSAILTSLIAAIKKEGGIDSPTDKLIKDQPELGIADQMARILAHANLHGLGINNTFDSGLQFLAAHKPETLTNMKQFIDFLNQVAAQEQAGPEGPAQGAAG